MPTSVFAALALMLNAFVWGVSWWPFRRLEGFGLHPLWATAAIYALALAGLLAWRPQALRALARHRGLWLLALAAGMSNLCFNWGVTRGDVVRVVLLFYLMPVWTVLLAWPLLGERPRPAALARMALAVAGVVVVLRTPGMPWPVPESLADWLGLVGGLCFSLTNIQLRRVRSATDESRMVAMFSGCMAVSALAATGGLLLGEIAAPPLPAPAWMLTALLLALAFIAGNAGMQYGAARLSANATALIMLSEVVFASLSAVALGAAQLAPRTLVGGAMVLLAAAWAALARPVEGEADARCAP
ncbi:DMT family transporter [Xylophilus sp. ASV27]|uniref:DMT family transporter n=1 Tax=Xylophilus sp. ASV27 TaxID=2795129 RepID=UPI0018EB1BCC|nr:DMT family transporter [Xylophilus sp. ASV27]